MKVLHTSDWHLGRTLYGRKRYKEFEAFLNWLVVTVTQHAVDVLLVAGDVFDTHTPSHHAQTLYYRFLHQVAASSCRHVVVIAGNHDSPAFLEAPKELLKALNVHVIGQACVQPEDEVVVLTSMHGMPEMIICAVPYLRDRDIRTVQPGESPQDKDRKMLQGIKAHYAAVTELAEQKRILLKADTPLVAMGHLFTAGGHTVEGDGVRDLYVGSLAHVAASIFPDSLDYLALGHLHVAQKVAGRENMRYSGSPLPMGFGEATQSKSVCLVHLTHHGAPVVVEHIEVPVFQALERVQGNWDDIARRLEELKTIGSCTWLEIIYTGQEIVADLRERLEAAIDGTSLEILRIRNNRIVDRILQLAHAHDGATTLDDLDVHKVFEYCLTAHEIEQQQHSELLRAYQEVLLSLQQGADLGP